MEPHEDSKSVKNLVKGNGGDCESNVQCKKAIPINPSAHIDNVFRFSLSANVTDTNLLPLNCSRISHVNSGGGEELTRPTRLSDNLVGCSNRYCANQNQTSKLNSHVEQPVAGCSNSDPRASNNIEHSFTKRMYSSDKSHTNSNGPSTSGINKSFNSIENNGSKESRKRPSSLKLNKTNFEADDSSSDTGNDDYSLGSEDGCIYTYRGGEHLVDLPSSFFSLDMGLPIDKHLPAPPNYVGPPQAVPNAREGSRASSPEMDFLEMDFDPGPSCEADTGDESTPEVDLFDECVIPEEKEPVPRGTSPDYLPEVRQPSPLAVPSTSSCNNDHMLSLPSTSQAIVTPAVEQEHVECKRNSDTDDPFITHTNVRGEQLLVRRTMSHWPATAPVSLHMSSGDLVSPRDVLTYEEEQAQSPHAHQINQGEKPIFDPANYTSTLYHFSMVKKIMVEKSKNENDDQNAECMVNEAGGSSGPACVEPPRCMVWSEREACERQITQIETSACGATAIANVFIALGVPVNVERINSAVGTRQRANHAPLPRYLLSRAVAGCTAADLVSGVYAASDGLVTGRFFHTYPERAVSLSHWLADWISLGAVPILTLNLQAACEGEIPDAWHHQMVFGVSSLGVYLCNPVECVRETTLWPRLTSPSVLLVRTRDVLTRFTPHTDLSPLMCVPDERFNTLNVLGQVVNVIHEWRANNWSEDGTRTRHIRIPASYQAGVTIVALTGSEAHRRLMHAPQLPILESHAEPR